MDDILGLIVFVIFLILQGIARSKVKKHNRERRGAEIGRTEQPMPRSFPIEERPRQQRVLDRTSSQVNRDNDQWLEPPEVFPNKETYMQVVHKPKVEKKAEALEEGRIVLSQKDLKQAILWSEILGPPRARKRNIR